MRGFAKHWVNRALRPLGLQIVAVQEDERAALVDQLDVRGIDHVVDAREGSHRASVRRVISARRLKSV